MSLDGRFDDSGALLGRGAHVIYSVLPAAPCRVGNLEEGSVSIQLRTRRIALAAGLTAAAVTFTPTAASAAPNQNNSGQWIQVVTNNIENGVPAQGNGTCSGRTWRNLITDLQKRYYLPDIFLAQQVSNRSQAYAIRDLLNSLSPGTSYDFVIARGEPSPDQAQKACGFAASDPSSVKRFQTNAIYWRTNRFFGPTPLNSSAAPVNQAMVVNNTTEHRTTFESYHRENGSCVENGQLRSRNIATVLYDYWAGYKKLTVASFHWPSDEVNGHACAFDNAWMASLLSANGDPGQSLAIVGGDSNIQKDITVPAGSSNWYNLWANFGFADACPGCGGTNGSDRIDFIFARRSNGATSPPLYANWASVDPGNPPWSTTFPFVEPSAQHYSDHKAVRAMISY